MKPLLFVSLLFLIGHNATAQYLNTNTFEYAIDENGYAQLWSNKQNHTTIDLNKEVIDNEYYVFVKGNIYEVDDNYENLIGHYNAKSITIYDETYTLQKPVFGKLTLRNEQTKEIIKIKTERNHVTFEPGTQEMSDVLKLWACQKGIEKILRRENLANNISFSVGVGF